MPPRVIPAGLPAAAAALAAALAAGLGVASARAAPPPPAATAAPAVLVLGDSITAGFGLPPGRSPPARLQARLAAAGRPVAVLAAGVFGDTAEGGLARLDTLPATRVAVVALGANDLLMGVPPRRTEAALHAVTARLKARGARVVLAGGRSPFGRSPAFDALFARVARSEGVALVPDVLAGVDARSGATLADGLHPNARGAERVAARLAPAVLVALGPPP